MLLTSAWAMVANIGVLYRFGGKRNSEMYVICTDGETVVRSKIVDDKELAELNQRAKEATGGNWWWEPGSKENAEYPKAEEYRHIPMTV